MINTPESEEQSVTPHRYNMIKIAHSWKIIPSTVIGGDFILIYDLRNEGAVIFVRAGTHADLFE